MSEGTQSHGYRTYLVTWGWLLVMTVLALGVGYVEMPPGIKAVLLVGITLAKVVLIAAIFMHLQGDDDSRVLTATALFPVFFIVVMVLFIGLTHPDAADTLPDWCRPGFYT